jgi:septal ring factor EnvC (AmiA/AmiB activator)
MKDRHSSEVIYALADYRQLVLTYRTKHAELVKSLTFWRTSVIWLCAFMALCSLAAMFWLLEKNKDLDSSRKKTEMLNAQVRVVSERLSRSEKELYQVREELKKKEEAIQSLKKNISTASKKLLEKLLVEQEESTAK